MNNLKIATFTFTLCGIFTALTSNTAFALDLSEEDYFLKRLGSHIFFDPTLSSNRLQSCAECHDPSVGWTEPRGRVNEDDVVARGAAPNTFGTIKPPTNAYSSFAPSFDLCSAFEGGVEPCGGTFWNGRAEGRSDSVGGALFPTTASKHIDVEVFQGISDPNILGYSKYFGPIADQALNPIPNPVEQNLDRQTACERVREQRYAEAYEIAWGEEINCSNDIVNVSAQDVSQPERQFDISFKRLMLAVSAYQHSKDVNSFSSKRDIALANDADGQFPLDDFTNEENLGHDLFFNITSALNPEGKRGNCRLCHQSGNSQGTSPQEIYTDGEYHNIGVPPNPDVPGNLGPEAGVASHTGNPADLGKLKTPTLRNVDKRNSRRFIKAYTHRGWFKSLESLVHFYNTANVDGATANSFGITRCRSRDTSERDALRRNCWPAPEQEANSAIGSSVGDLGLTSREEAAIVAYLKTLSDTVTAEPPRRFRLNRL